MSPDDPDADASEPATCTFTGDEFPGSTVSAEVPECSRPVWEKADSAQCVWHAESADKPPDELAATVGDGELSGVSARESDLTTVSFPEGSRFTGADLSGATLSDADLSEAHLDGAVLSRASLRGADLSGATLLHTDLSRADLASADLSGAYLDGADFSGASLRYTTLDSVSLHETTLQNAIINEGTTASPPSRWERRADAVAESGLFGRPGFRRLRALRRSASNPDHLQWAEQQYRRIERLYRENDLVAPLELAVQEKHARRKRALAEGNRLRWLRGAFSRWVLGYGLLYWPILLVMLFVIVGCAIVYPHPALGFEDGALAAGANETATITYESVPPRLSWETAQTLVWETVQTLGRSLYFSTITFSTLGYADVYPTGGARGVATFESFVGALSMAYLVSVLSRRAIR